MLAQLRAAILRRSLIHLVVAGTLIATLSCSLGIREASAASGGLPGNGDYAAGLLPPISLGLSITAVLPASGPSAGGTPIIIAGIGLQAGATVTLDGVEATDVRLAGLVLIATTPAHAAGTVDVAVKNRDGRSAILVDSFTFVETHAPAITQVSSSAPLFVGTEVTLEVLGLDFSSDATVLLNGQPLETHVTSSTQLIATVPADRLTLPGIALVTVINGTGGEVSNVLQLLILLG